MYIRSYLKNSTSPAPKENAETVSLLSLTILSEIMLALTNDPVRQPL